ncbi:ATP-binding protein [Thermopolyspora sp. NPDC052614]|uniref:ATP-binding protein n=1 Tax=Thermopolyspora sp. NPDC052614 TaxID=3155682 RepID=UPI0034382484
MEAVDRIRVEITDLGGGHVPAVHDDVDAVNGRGLLLVAAIAARWGVDGDANGRTVWFVLDP